MGVRVANISGVEKPNRWLGIRHVQVLMVFLGMTLLVIMRAAMSIAVVAMTDPDRDNTFDWSIQRQSVILSSFTWGYIVMQGPSGELANKFGGMPLFILNVASNSLVALLLPAAAMYGGWLMVCVCRAIQGLMQGSLYATSHYLIGKWVPLEERGRTSCLVFSGNAFGTACSMLISGFVAEYWGWPAIFYVNGVAGFIWTLVYLIVGADNPQVSKLIGAKERLYVQSSLGQIGGHKRLKTPWKAILTSLPFLAGLAANIGSAWGYWILLTEIPTYMSKIVLVDIKSNGVLSALPYIITFLLNFPIGIASDYFTKKKWVSVTASRKIFNSIACFGPAIVLLFLTYVPPGNVALAVFLFCLVVGCGAGFYGGYLLIFLDMAHNFSSTLVALANFTGNALALFAPLSVGYILEDENDPKEWRLVFAITAIVYAASNIIFLIFATSEEQEWNKGTEICTNKQINE